MLACARAFVQAEGYDCSPYHSDSIRCAHQKCLHWLTPTPDNISVPYHLLTWHCPCAARPGSAFPNHGMLTMQPQDRRGPCCVRLCALASRRLSRHISKSSRVPAVPLLALHRPCGIARVLLGLLKPWHAHLLEAQGRRGPGCVRLCVVASYTCSLRRCCTPALLAGSFNLHHADKHR